MASPEATSRLPLVRPLARTRAVVGEPIGKPVFGDRRGLFGLVVKNTLLTIVTLGIYRFWAKARERTRAAAAPRRVAVPRRVTPPGSASKASGETVEG